MHHLLAKVIPFLAIVFGHWQVWLSGGGLGGLLVIAVGLIEKISGRKLSTRAHVYMFLIAFFICSCFLAWMEESDRLESTLKDKSALVARLENEELSFSSKEQRLISDCAAKQGAVEALGGQIRAQQGNIDKCLIELGAQVARPQKLEVYDINGDLRNERGADGFVVLEIDKEVSPVRLLTKCSAPIDKVNTRMLGVGFITTGGWGGFLDPGHTEYGETIDSPIWTARNPILLAIYLKDRGSLVHCDVELK